MLCKIFFNERKLYFMFVEKHKKRKNIIPGLPDFRTLGFEMSEFVTRFACCELKVLHYGI